MDYAKAKRYALKGLAVAGFVLLAVMLRVLWLGWTHYNIAEAHLAKGETKLAIREYETAMRHYVPFSPHISRSAERLWDIGNKLESGKDLYFARTAYSSLRSGFYSARSFYTPGGDWIEKCDRKIADISIAILINDGLVKPENAQNEREKYMRLLKADRAPKPLWSILSFLSFLGWCGAAAYAALWGVGEGGALKKTELLRGGAWFAAFFLLWTITLYMA